MQKVNEAFRPFGWFDQHRTGSVSKQRAGGAIIIVNNRRHYIDSDHQYSLMSAAFNKLYGSLHSIEKAAATCREIEPPGAPGSQPVLYKTSRGWEHHVGSNGSDKNRVEACGLNLACSQQLFCGFHGQVRAGNSTVDNVPLPNTGPFDQPGVGSVNHLFQIAVG